MTTIDYDIQLFSELYDVHPQPIVWMTPVFAEDGSTIIDFAFTYFNQEWVNFLNLPREKQQDIRLSIIPTLNADLRQKFMEEMISVFKTGKQLESTVFNPTLNKFARMLCTKLRGGVLTIVQDRTEEVLTIKELQEKTELLERRESLLTNLLQYSPAGISVTEVIRDEKGKVVDGRTILANDLSYTLTGVPKELTQDKTIREIDPAMLKSPLYQMALRTLQTGEPFHTQYYLQPTGRWLELSVSRMDEDHLINIFSDITATKESQLITEQANERMQAVFNASQSGMITLIPIKNQQGEVVDFRYGIVNPSYATMVGYAAEMLQGAVVSTFFPGYLTNGVFDYYKGTYLTGEPRRQDVHYHFDGLDVYLDILSTKIGDEVLVTMTDHTALKKTQLDQEKLVESLKRSNTSLEEFAHAASHDLKEPIRKVYTFSDRLKQGLEDRLTEQERDLFQRMQNATERMTQLVDDLLTYSHLSLIPLEKDDVDLNNKICLVLSDLEVLIEDKKAVIHLEKLPTIKGYRRQIQQLFQNLISNALKYHKPGLPAQIWITCREVIGADLPLHLPSEYSQRQYYLIEVRDNGIGFEQEYAQKIFEMFKRLHGKSEYPGTGVGLSIARKVVDNHQGYIWAKSELGINSSFFVLFPK